MSDLSSGRWRAGAQLGEWVIERSLGQGGMGAVFAARHVGTGAQRAIKLLTGRDARARERFAREGRALARFGRHPGIVGIDLVGETEAGEPYLVLELVEGASLEARLAGGPLPVAEVTRIGGQLARALAHVHAHGVVHRDLKPANVLLRPDGAAVLTDFGIARDESEARLTASQALVGTLEFMAPEQVAPSRSVPVGPATDVFALGALLWTLLAGASPFAGESFVEVAHRITEAPIPPPGATRRDVPADLDALVLWCLERDAAARPTAADVAAALDAIAAGRRAAVPSRRRGAQGRTLAALGLALALAFALALALAFARDPVAEVARPRPTTAPTRPQPAPRVEPRGRKLLAALQAEGHGRLAAWREACLAVRASPGDPALAEVRAKLEALAERPLLVMPAAPAASVRAWATPLDDEHVLLTSPDAAGATLLGLRDGSTRPWIRAKALSSAPACVARSSRRRVVVLATTAGAAHAIERAAADDLDAPAVDASPFSAPGDPVTVLAASPEGRRLAAGGAFGGIAVFDLDAGAASWLESPKAGARARTRALAFSPDGALLATGGGEGGGEGDRSPGWVVVHVLATGATVVTDMTPVNVLRFGARGGLVACTPRTLYLIDLRTGALRPARELGQPLPFGENGFIRDMDLAGDLVWTAGDAQLLAWRWDGGEGLPVALVPRPRRGPEVAGIRCTPDGALLLVSTAEPPTLEVWGAEAPGR